MVMVRVVVVPAVMASSRGPAAAAGAEAALFSGSRRELVALMVNGIGGCCIVYCVWRMEMHGGAWSIIGR
jgi:hypothetical protein